MEETVKRGGMVWNGTLWKTGRRDRWWGIRNRVGRRGGMVAGGELVRRSIRLDLQGILQSIGRVQEWRGGAEIEVYSGSGGATLKGHPFTYWYCAQTGPLNLGAGSLEFVLGGLTCISLGSALKWINLKKTT